MNFTLLMTIVFKYKLPIVLLKQASDSRQYGTLYRAFAEILEKYKMIMFLNLEYLEHFGNVKLSEIGINNKDELVTAILRQVTPQSGTAQLNIGL